jgi:hypothetical protein
LLYLLGENKTEEKGNLPLYTNNKLRVDTQGKLVSQTTDTGDATGVNATAGHYVKISSVSAFW